MNTLEKPDAPAPSVSPPPAADRRRPGRAENVNPNLIALLRAPATSAANADLTQSSHDDLGHGDLGPAKGLIVSVVFSALFWALLAYFLL